MAIMGIASTGITLNGNSAKFPILPVNDQIETKAAHIAREDIKAILNLFFLDVVQSVLAVAEKIIFKRHP
jgi:hypothetical protein